MARNAQKIARELGATIDGKVPNVGGGAFGAARMARILAVRLTPAKGKRPGRPTNPDWVHHPKVPMSEDTRASLKALAEQLSTPQRRISPMQVAAQLLEETVDRYAGSPKG